MYAACVLYDINRCTTVQTLQAISHVAGCVPECVLRSAQFGLPQSRRRLYILMVRKDLLDASEFRNLKHIISYVLPNQFPRRGTIQEMQAYNRDVMKSMNTVPLFPTVAKDSSLHMSGYHFGSF